MRKSFSFLLFFCIHLFYLNKKKAKKEKRRIYKTQRFALQSLKLMVGKMMRFFAWVGWVEREGESEDFLGMISFNLRFLMRKSSKFDEILKKFEFFPIFR